MYYICSQITELVDKYQLGDIQFPLLKKSLVSFVQPGSVAPLLQGPYRPIPDH